MSRYITGIDLGTSTIKVAIAETSNSGVPKIIFLSLYPSQGIIKGSISHSEETEKAIRIALDKVKSVAKGALKTVYLNIGGTKNKTQISKGMVVVSRADNEIYHDDVERVKKASEDATRSHNRTVIHTITKEFIVDGMPGIEDPIGLIGNRLEVESFIVDSFSHDIRNLERVVESSEGIISGMIFNPISSATSVLTKNQKDLGVALIDIGASTTSLSVYEEGKMIHAVVLPVGSANITNDIAIGLKIPIEIAESLKLSLGYAISKNVSIREKMDLKKFNIDEKSPASKKFFIQIIEDRLSEIFELVNNELKLISKDKRLPAGAVLTGGAAKLPGIIDLARQELRLPAQLGIVSTEQFISLNSDMAERMEDPEYANCLGLVLFGHQSEKEQAASEQGIFSKIIGYFLP